MDEDPDGTVADHLTAALTTFVGAPPRLGDAGRGRALQAVTDTVGVLLAGSRTEAGRLVREYVGAGPLTTRDSAMVLGTWAHALDYDDIDSSVPGHPSAVLVPTLLAEAGRTAISGERFIEAFAVGYEVASKLGRVLGQRHYDRGWHSTSTVVVFGAVAALASARDLDQRLTARAFGIAASTSAGLRRNFGTMTKPLHCGWAAHSAHVAVGLAGLGFTGAEDALGGTAGFVELYGDGGAAALAPLGAPYTLDSPGITLKRYPCCGGTHRGIDAVLELVSDRGLGPSDIARVVCTVPPTALAPLRTDLPATGLEAKFSLEYALAAAVLDGNVGLASFSDAAVRRPAVRRLMQRVRVREDDRCLAGASLAGRSPHQVGYVEVVLELADGTSVTRRVAKARGTVSRPLGRPELEAKFRDCVAAAGRPREVDGLLAGLKALPGVPDVRAVTAAVAEALDEPAWHESRPTTNTSEGVA